MKNSLSPTPSVHDVVISSFIFDSQWSAHKARLNPLNSFINRFDPKSFAFGAKLGSGGWFKWITGGLSVLNLGEFQRGIEADPDFPDPETPNAHFAFGNGVMKYLIFHDPEWDYSTYDFSSFKSDAAAAAQTLDATDPNLDAFRERGGKLLMFNGWRDMALSPLGTIKYYEQLIERASSAAEDVRLIMLPGVDHCLGGPGPSFVNWVDEIDRWLETGQAPAQVEAYWLNQEMQAEGSRPACAYPARLKYDGAGDPRTAASFLCEVCSGSAERPSCDDKSSSSGMVL